MAHVVIKLPDVGEGTAQAELAGWRVNVGDAVSEDQTLAEVTTDKATVEVPSPTDGTVVALHGTPGDVIAVGSPLIEIQTGAADENLLHGINGQERAPTPGTQSPVPALSSKKAPTNILASPAVRARATGSGIDLSRVVGTGPGGRILHKDLDTYLLYQGQTPASHRSISQEAHLPFRQPIIKETKIIGIRRQIAERMQDSKRNIPHFSYVEEVDMTAVEELKAQINAEAPAGQVKITVLPFVVTAMIQAIADFPQVNGHFEDDKGLVREFSDVHVGIATQTDKGLMVPVVFDAGRQPLLPLANSIAAAAERARAGKADRRELGGSTITVTSLGKLGGIASTPIINRPEVAIVGVNKVLQRPVVAEGQVIVRSMMNLSSSFDHRIVDGWVAAAFIQRLKMLLERPAWLLLPGTAGQNKEPAEHVQTH